MISPEEHKATLERLCQLAREAGARIMPFYGGRSGVTLKSDASPLTDADRASHHYLVEQLATAFPGVPITSEESEPSSQDLGSAVEQFWLVDPLDGTKEFLKGAGEFTVNVALIDHDRPVLGVVYAPVLDLMYYAALGSGAFRTKGSGAPRPIRVQPAGQGSLKIVASKDHAGPMVAALLERIPNPELKSMGSSLKFCLVAQGDADLYLRDVPTMEWDTAAAQCVVEAAGGGVFTLDGQSLRYGKPGLKNPAIITVGDPAFAWRELIQ